MPQITNEMIVNAFLGCSKDTSPSALKKSSMVSIEPIACQRCQAAGTITLRDGSAVPCSKCHGCGNGYFYKAEIFWIRNNRVFKRVRRHRRKVLCEAARERGRLSCAERYRNNREEIKRRRKLGFYKSDQVKLLARAARQREQEATKVRIAKWRAENIEWLRQYDRDRQKEKSAYQRERRRNDPQVKVAHRLRARLRVVMLSGRMQRKLASAMDLVGCSASELVTYLEGLFQPGMTWANIHIDHIKPVASFDVNDPGQVRACFHYTNLQPLWPPDNFKKGKRRWKAE